MTNRETLRAVLFNRYPASMMARFTIWLAGAYGIVQGVGLMLCDPVRMSGPTFAYVRRIPDGQVWWGLAALVFGVVILVGSLTRTWAVKAVGLLGVSAWCGFLGWNAWAAVQAVATIAPTGPPTYGYIAIGTAILVWIDERKGRYANAQSTLATPT